MCGYFCIRFIGFMFAMFMILNKTLVDFTSLLSAYDFKKKQKKKKKKTLDYIK